MAESFLSDHPVIHAADAGRLRDAVDGLTGYDHAVVDAMGLVGRPRGTVNGLRIGELSLVFVAYAAQVRVFAPPTRDQVVLVVPLGPMRVETAGRVTLLDQPFVLSGVAETTMLPDPFAGALVGAIHVSEMTALLREGFGAEREFAVDLAQARPIPVNAGAALRRVWSAFARDPGGDASLLLDRLAIGLAPFVSYGSGESLVGGPPAYLTEAVRLLRRRLAEPDSLVGLADTVGIGTRQLQLAFQAHLGRTAQEYLRDARLDRAWSLLRAAGGTAGGQVTVAQVAAEVGIPHSGRFSRYFAERFGLRPSDLLS